MKRKVLIGIAVVLLLAGFAFFTVASDELHGEGQCGDNAYWSYDYTTNQFEITGVGTLWNKSDWTGSLYSSSFAKSIIVSDGITNIPSAAFSSFDRAETVHLGSNIVDIGSQAFLFCRRLKSIIIPSGVVEISNATFNYCESLEEVYFESNDNLKTVGQGAFSHCTNLRTIEMPNSVEIIKLDAFRSCSMLESIEIPESVKTIEAYTFNGCQSLKAVSFPDGLTAIESWAFTNCKSLSSIELPDTLKSIGYDAFAGCESLKSIFLPDNLTSIGFSVFENCINLQNVRLPSALKVIPYGMFDGCVRLTNIDIPNTVTEIGINAFRNCTRLKKIVLPHTLKTISSEAFKNCKNLEEIAFPADLESIRDSAFEGCTSLRKAILPDKMKSTGKNIFKDCRNLLVAKYPSNFKYLGEGSFANCDSLRVVYLPDCLTQIKKETFKNCPCITEVHFGGTTEQWNKVIIEEGNESLTVPKENKTVIYQSKPSETAIVPVEQDVLAMQAARQLESIKGAVTLDASMGNLNEILDAEQMDYLGKVILCAVAQAEIPKETLSDYLDRTVIERVFKCDTQLLKVHDGEIGVTAFVSSPYGPLQIRFDCSYSKYALSGESFGFFGNINYTIIGGEGKNHLLDTIALSGFAGGLSGYDMESFCKAAWKVTEDVLKDAYDTTYGDNANQAADLIFGKGVNRVLKAAKKLKLTKAGSVSDVYWIIITTPAKKVYIECPVDVFVLDQSGNVVASVENNEVTATNEHAAISVYGDKKTVWLFDSSYTIQYVATDNGSMRVTVEEYGFSDGLLKTSVINNIPLTTEKTYTQTVDNQLVGNSDYTIVSADEEQYNVASERYALHEHQADGISYAEVEPQCEDYGYINTYCTVCNEWFLMPTQAGTGHTEVIDEAVPASCAADGLTQGKHCSVCGEVIAKQQTIPATGHAWGDWSIVKPATETEEGLMERVCQNNASHTETKPIEKLQPHTHTYTSTVTAEPTCTDDGETTYTCSVCGDTYTEPIPATGEHVDADNSGYCDTCEEMMVGPDHCTYCGKIHGGLFGWLVSFFHRILAIFKR